MPTLIVLANGTIPVAEDFMFNFNALNRVAGVSTAIASYATGDLLYASAPNTLTARAVGSSGQVLTVVGGVPAWAAPGAGLPRAYGAGCALSNNTTDATNDLDIAPGAWRSDDNTEDLVLASTLTKQLDVAWAVGPNAGGLDTGTKAVSTWYHVWLIKRPDTGVVDATFSESATAPTMPASYTKKRRLGAVRTDSSGAITAFVQSGDYTYWNVSTAAFDFDGATGTGANTVTHRVPTGVGVLAFGAFWSSSGTADGYLSPLSTPDLTPSSGASPSYPLQNLMRGLSNTSAPWGPILTNTSGQTRWRFATSTTLKVATYGWIDRRGRDA